MTPQELLDKANKVRTLQENLRIIEDDDAYIVINFHDSKVYIRSQGSQSIQLSKELTSLMLTVATAVRTQTIEEIDTQINTLCE